MSEIFGIACAKDAFNTHEKAAEEQTKTFETMLLHCEDSGKDATGAFFVNRIDEKDYAGTLFKIDLPSKKFMKRHEYKELRHKTYGKTLQAAIGHCRKASHGAPASDRNNNHPVSVRGVVGVHLGSITNHESLWKDHGGKNSYNQRSVWRSGDVDSEVVFYLIGKALREDSDMTFEGAIVETTKKLKGTYACAAIDLHRPKYIMLFTNQKEIYYYSSPSLNQVVFSTDFDAIQAALKANNFVIVDAHKDSVPPHSGLRINTETLKLRPFVLASEEVTNTEVKNIIVRQTGGVAGF